MSRIKTNRFTRITLTLSIALLVAWAFLGTGASLAWFTDESPEIVNVFNFAEFDLEVSYKNHTMTDYAPMEIDSNVFGDEALYEPGYTQVVYLKVKNNGTREMQYKLSIDVRSVKTVPGVLGNDIYLPNYLRYGVVFGANEDEMTRELARKNAAWEMAPLELNNFTQWDDVILAPGAERILALIVHMPESVGNQANHRGQTPPSVGMGITVYAQQTGVN